jgi:hypothetical protein
MRTWTDKKTPLDFEKFEVSNQGLKTFQSGG